MMIRSRSDLEVHAKACVDRNIIVQQAELDATLIDMLEEILIGAAHPIGGYYPRDVLRVLYISGDG